MNVAMPDIPGLSAVLLDELYEVPSFCSMLSACSRQGRVCLSWLQGSNLDVYAKQWRLFADCLNNAGKKDASVLSSEGCLQTP